MKCPYCGAENNDSAKFCKECGKSIQKEFNYACPKCGSPVEEKSKFCDNCGLELQWVDADYDKIPVPIKSKNKKIDANSKESKRTMPQLVASIVTASLVFISLLIMFIGLFGDVFVTRSGGTDVKMQFSYFFGDAFKSFSGINLNQYKSAQFMYSIIVIQHVFYFLMFVSIIATFIALAIVLTLDFIKGRKLRIKPLLIPMIASAIFVGYTQIAFCLNQTGSGLFIGSGPIMAGVGAIIGVLAIVSNSFNNWPLSKPKILERSFFGAAMVFLIFALSYLFVSPIAIHENSTSAMQFTPSYFVSGALNEIDSGNPAPAYYGSAIMTFIFAILAVFVIGLSIYLMNKQKILAAILAFLSIPMLVVPSIILGHDFAVATVSPGQTLYFGISSYVIAFIVFIGLSIASLIVSIVFDRKAKKEESLA
jgi:hypothetical protein